MNTFFVKRLIVIICGIIMVVVMARGFYNQSFSKIDHILSALSLLIIVGINYYDASKKKKNNTM